VKKKKKGVQKYKQKTTPKSAKHLKVQKNAQ
jgi:hypothetical protein